MKVRCIDCINVKGIIIVPKTEYQAAVHAAYCKYSNVIIDTFVKRDCMLFHSSYNKSLNSNQNNESFS